MSQSGVRRIEFWVYFDFSFCFGKKFSPCDLKFTGWFRCIGVGPKLRTLFGPSNCLHWSIVSTLVYCVYIGGSLRSLGVGGPL